MNLIYLPLKSGHKEKGEHTFFGGTNDNQKTNLSSRIQARSGRSALEIEWELGITHSHLTLEQEQARQLERKLAIAE
ncbi:MAG: hypothetical protein KDD45_01040 [Bdellovibrionales bacterium]|nr:hypothetical protein [Bdellovibrionales bacterium]